LQERRVALLPGEFHRADARGDGGGWVVGVGGDGDVRGETPGLD
jgi:hypothetical protein